MSSMKQQYRTHRYVLVIIWTLKLYLALLLKSYNYQPALSVNPSFCVPVSYAVILHLYTT